MTTILIGLIISIIFLIVFIFQIDNIDIDIRYDIYLSISKRRLLRRQRRHLVRYRNISTIVAIITALWLSTYFC